MSMNAVGESAWPIRAAEHGWHRLKDYAHAAMTYFKPSEDTDEAEHPQRWGALATDVVDHGNQLEVRMEVPGVASDELTVTINGRYLIIAGERRSDGRRREGTVVITERAFGRFQRTIPLADEVVADQVKAKYSDGVLIVELPKSQPSQSGRIEVPVT